MADCSRQRLARTGSRSSLFAMSERRATSAELYAMSKHLGVRCGDLQIAYMRCKEKYNHPEDCLQEAKAVVRCSDNL